MRIKGFTLIELVMVIVILGILSAFAIPKYADFSSDANLSVVNAFSGDLRSIVGIVQSAAALNGVVDGSMTFEGENIEIRGGYPRANWNATFANLWSQDFGGFTNVNVICDEDLCGVGNQTNLPGVGSRGRFNVIVWPRGFRASDGCYAWYHNGNETGGDNEIEFGVESAGC